MMYFSVVAMVVVYPANIACQSSQVRCRSVQWTRDSAAGKTRWRRSVAAAVETRRIRAGCRIRDVRAMTDVLALLLVLLHCCEEGRSQSSFALTPSICDLVARLLSKPLQHCDEISELEEE